MSRIVKCHREFQKVKKKHNGQFSRPKVSQYLKHCNRNEKRVRILPHEKYKLPSFRHRRRLFVKSLFHFLLVNSQTNKKIFDEKASSSLSISAFNFTLRS